MDSSSLCSNCSVLTQDSLVSFDLGRYTYDPVQTFYFSSKIEHEDPREAKAAEQTMLAYTANEFKASIAAECPLCMILAEQCRSSESYQQDEAIIPFLEIAKNWKPGDVLPDADSGTHGATLLLYQLSGSEQPPRQIGNLRLVPVPRSLFVPPVTRLPSSIDKHTIQRITDWLDICGRGEHPACSGHQSRMRFSPTDYPSRLLEITMPDSEIKVRLRELSHAERQPQDVEPQYATLSHCWGPQGLKCKLEMDNLDRFLEDIPLQSLPRTFQEAVVATLSLGIHHIWIDALCIIQDSSSDWIREAPRMAGIYNNSIVTLAATASSSSEGGLFRQDRHLAPLIVPCNWVVDDGNAVEFGYVSTDHHVQTSVLTTRAWVFQERLLARRTISFSADQLSWSCTSKSSVEHKLSEYVSHAAADNARLLRRGTPLEIWLPIVEEYTRKSLTFGRDRLVALAGVAQAYCRLSDLQESNYVAGLWSSDDLKAQLLWYCQNPKEKSVRKDEPDVYIAPSWAWPAVNHQVQFRRIVQPSRRNTGSIWNPLFNISTASAQTAGSGYFGPAVSGSIVVKSVIQSAKLLAIPTIGTGSYVLSMAGHEMLGNLKSSEKGQFDLWLDPGWDERKDLYLEVAFLPMLRDVNKTYSTTTDIIRGLLALPVLENTGVYKRIGYLDVKCEARAHLSFKPALEAIWTEGSSSLEACRYLLKHNDGTYEFEIQ